MVAHRSCVAYDTVVYFFRKQNATIPERVEIERRLVPFFVVDGTGRRPDRCRRGRAEQSAGFAQRSLRGAHHRGRREDPDRRQRGPRAGARSRRARLPRRRHHRDAHRYDELSAPDRHRARLGAIAGCGPARTTTVASRRSWPPASRPVLGPAGPDQPDRRALPAIAARAAPAPAQGVAGGAAHRARDLRQRRAVRREADVADAGQDLRSRARREDRPRVEAAARRVRGRRSAARLDDALRGPARLADVSQPRRGRPDRDRRRDPATRDAARGSRARSCAHRSRRVAGREPAVRGRCGMYSHKGMFPAAASSRSAIERSSSPLRFARAARRPQGLLPVRDAVGLGDERGPHRRPRARLQPDAQPVPRSGAVQRELRVAGRSDRPVCPRSSSRAAASGRPTSAGRSRIARGASSCVFDAERAGRRQRQRDHRPQPVPRAVRPVRGRLEPDGLPPITVDDWFGMGEEFRLRC